MLYSPRNVLVAVTAQKFTHVNFKEYLTWKLL
ncbi:hypothetical protein STSP2_00587 [Anaerohalosphaera lusitana]|uniref:Uncharacterized protein n=1 Tax=Anaerohalosphaera lusitana TaxID=1936003 RepID=A0A1U9NIM2_9BACT|nr:hypothetical protein STSP2_00587 [Anaerohalosphaera lusitana]